MATPLPRRFPRLVETLGEEPAASSDAPAGPTSAGSEPSPYLAGEVVGDRYRLVREIGRGGMGVVWVAHSLVLGVDIALKLIRASAASSALSSRMAREAHAAARLGHPALVRVFDFGWTRRGDPYLVMELVQGETLAAQLKRETRIPAIVAVQTLLPIVDGLRMAHDKGIIHRDIKPDNVFLAADALGRRQPKLLDFGIAKVDKQVDGRLTQMGAVLGSPDYMSPEQALGLDDIDERTDIWSLCVVLYEVITGALPFQKSNYNALMHAIINEPPTPSVEFSAGDQALWEVIERGLRKQRQDRFANVTELGEALALWLYEHGVKEDLSGNSVRAVWLDAAMTAGLRDLPSERPLSTDSAGMQQNGAARMSTPVGTARGEASRVGERNKRSLYFGLPVFALVLAALGAWLVASFTGKASVRGAAPLAAAAGPATVPIAAVPADPPTAVPAPTGALPSATASPRSSGKTRAHAPVVRKKGRDFGF